MDTGTTKTYSPNTLNQYTAAEGTAVSNGSEHEIASYQGNTYSYINDERLKTVSSGSNNYSLAYDALGRCVKRTLNGVTIYYVYDGEKPILEYNSSGTIVGRNLYGKAIDEILLRVDVANNWTLYYQQDHEGSVTHLTDASGAVLPYLPPSLFNYRLPERVFLVGAPVISITCIILCLLAAGRSDMRFKLAAVTGVISALPLIWLGISFLLWKLFGFAP